jgi:CheY-like chemotaxis protein
MADLPQVVQLTTALEALLFEAMDKETYRTPSVRRTIDLVIGFLGELLDRCREGLPPTAARGQVLVVDDDAVCNRAVVAALRRAQLDACSVETPSAALECLGRRGFDLALLDVRMPEIDGFELRRRIRALPGAETMPIVFVTSLREFEVRAAGELAHGEDLIGKPILPTELAVKALMHVLKHQMSTGASA